MLSKKRKKSKRKVFPSIVSEYPVRRFGVDGGFASATPYIGQLNYVEQILIENARLSNGAQSLVKKRIGDDIEIVSKIVGAYIVSKIKKPEKDVLPIPQDALSGFIIYAGNNEAGYYAQMLTDLFEPVGNIFQCNTMEGILSLFRLEGQTDLYERADFFFDGNYEESMTAKDETYADIILLSGKKSSEHDLYGPLSGRFCPISPAVMIDIKESSENTVYQYPTSVQTEQQPLLQYTGSSYYVERKFCAERESYDYTQRYYSTIHKHREMTSTAINSGDSCLVSFGLSRIVKNKKITATHIPQFQTLSTTVMDHVFAVDWHKLRCDSAWQDILPMSQISGATVAFFNDITAHVIESPAGKLENIKIDARAINTNGVVYGDIDTDTIDEDIEEYYRTKYFGPNNPIEIGLVDDAAYPEERYKYHISSRDSILDFIIGYDSNTGLYGQNNKYINYESKAMRAESRGFLTPLIWVHGRILEQDAYAYVDKVQDSESGDASTRIIYAVIDSNMRTIEAFIQLFRMAKYSQGVKEGWQNRMRAAVKVCEPDGTRNQQAEENLKNSIKNFTSSVRLLQFRAGKLSKDLAEVITGTMGIHRYTVGDDQKKSLSFGKLLSEFLAETNRVRQSNGVDRLSWSYSLSVAARMHAVDCANNGVFGHYGTAGNGPIHRCAFGQYGTKAYRTYAIGENIAYAQNSAVDAIAAFMASTDGHRENLLHQQWKEVGLCVVPSAPGVILPGFGLENYLIWVQVFGLQQQF